MLEKGMGCGHWNQGREQAPAFGRLRAPAGACARMERGCRWGAGKAPEMPPAATKPSAPQNRLPLGTGQQARAQVHV